MKRYFPYPGSLSTQILPPCFSTNSLQSNRPNPVPDSASVPDVDKTFEISNSFNKLSGAIPTPLSVTDIVVSFAVCTAEIFITPSLFVNFIALETRFLKTVFNISISAKIFTLLFSAQFMVIPLESAPCLRSSSVFLQISSKPYIC